MMLLRGAAAEQQQLGVMEPASSSSRKIRPKTSTTNLPDNEDSIRRKEVTQITIQRVSEESQPVRLVLGEGSSSNTGSDIDEDDSEDYPPSPLSPVPPVHRSHSHEPTPNTSRANYDDSPVARSLSTSPSACADVVHTVDRIGSYVIGKTLGEGAFAKVKQATHTLTGITVAIKIIYKHKITEDYVRDNLRREGELMKKLDHPHVLKLLEIIETPRAYCLVTELAGGGEVLDYIVAHGCLSEKEARKYVRQMISSVGHLHANDIVHRDLKAENLLLDENLNLKIIDFGLSNSMKGKDFLMTQCGSPAYTAPELLGGKKYGPPVDIWSIGINMYAMLTGRLPFSSNNVTTLHALILDQKYDIPDHFSAGCIDILAKLLQVKPKDRISLDELRKHPWVVHNDVEVPAEVLKPKRTVEDMNSAVLKQMVKMGNDLPDVVEAVAENHCNHLSALYHILEMKQKEYSSPSSSHMKSVTRSTSVGSNLGPPRRSTEGDVSPISSSFESRGMMRRPSLSVRHGSARKVPPVRTSSTRRNSLDVTSARTLRRIDAHERSPTRTVSANVPGLRRSSRSMKELAGLGGVASIEPSSRRQSISDTRFRRSASVRMRRSSDSFDDEASNSYEGRVSQLPALPSGRSSPTSFRRRTSSMKSPSSPALVRKSQGNSPNLTRKRAGSRRQARPPSNSPTKDPVIRTLRYPFSRQMVSSKPPVTLFGQLKRALQMLHIFATAGEGSDLCLACMSEDIRFEAEIVKVPRLPVHGVHFRRLRGDADQYKTLCTAIIDEMDL